MSPEELEEKVYDRFDIELKQLQILMAKPGQFYSRENIF
jgi:DNA-binding response OmpR family regulator